MSKITERYSGPNSVAFWAEIANVENKEVHDLLYIAGCALQDHEKRFFQMLRCALPPADRQP